MKTSVKKLSFYVAAPFPQKEKARQIMDRLEKDGYTITSDWTTHPPVKPYDQNPDLAGKFAQEDIQGATTCDIFIMLPDAEGGTTLFAELGSAIVSDKVKRIFVVGQFNTRSAVFFHPRVERVPDFESVLRSLS